MPWEAINAIIAIFAFLFMVFLEWPRFSARLRESRLLQESRQDPDVTGMKTLGFGLGVVLFGLIWRLWISPTTLLVFLGLLLLGLAGVIQMILDETTKLLGLVSLALIFFGLAGIVDIIKF